MGTLNSEIDNGFASGSAANGSAAIIDDPGVGREILVFAADKLALEYIEGAVRPVEPDMAESREGEGETLTGREIAGGAVAVDVMGNPRSFMSLKTLLKSESLLNFN